ncbi:MAG TPA: zinc-finger-containing protein, partial [Leptolyngbyaceae cyanobacterium]
PCLKLRALSSLYSRQSDKRKLFTSRQAAYKWLSRAMRLPPALTHVAMFNIRQCQRVIAS